MGSNEVLRTEYNSSSWTLRRVQEASTVKEVFVRLKPSSFHLWIESADWSQSWRPSTKPPKRAVFIYFDCEKSSCRFYIYFDIYFDLYSCRHTFLFDTEILTKTWMHNSKVPKVVCDGKNSGTNRTKKRYIIHKARKNLKKEHQSIG